jgi:ABC-type transport system involved in multi-copper enzyme maturation permease subunit
MILTIIKKEIREAVLSFRFLIATLLCLFLIPVGMYVNLKDYEKRLADYQESVRLYEGRSKGNIGSDFSAEGYRPPSLLSVFSVGLEYFLPNKMVTARDGNIHTSNEQGVDNPQSLLFGKVDLLFNISYVISLLALIFTFSTITGEKEDGTFRLVMSNPVPRSQILLAKIIGNYIVLLVPLFLSIVVSLVILNASGAIPVFSAEVLPAFFTILLMTLLYVLAMFNLGILVSTLTHRSITSIVALLFIWAILVLSLPKISPMIAEIIYPVKSQQVFNMQKAMAREDIGNELFDKAGQLYNDLAPQYGVSPGTHYTLGRTESEKQLLVVYDSLKGILDREYEQKMNSEMKKLDEEFENQRKTQASIAMNLSRLSPASCYAYIVSEVCATGTIEAYKFTENAARYQAEVKENIYDKYIVKIYGDKYGSASSTNRVKGFDASKVQVPHLNYQHATLDEALGAEWVDILLILLFNVFFFAASYVSFLRYDVR